MNTPYIDLNYILTKNHVWFSVSNFIKHVIQKIIYTSQACKQNKLKLSSQKKILTTFWNREIQNPKP